MKILLDTCTALWVAADAAELSQRARDPFDRMLICQAIMGGMTLLTPDQDIRRYPVATAW